MEFLLLLIQRLFFESVNMGLASHTIKTLYNVTQSSFYHIRHVVALVMDSPHPNENPSNERDRVDLFEAVLDALNSENEKSIEKVRHDLSIEFSIITGLIEMNTKNHQQLQQILAFPNVFTMGIHNRYSRG
jgi:hypothetical protein